MSSLIASSAYPTISEPPVTFVITGSSSGGVIGGTILTAGSAGDTWTQRAPPQTGGVDLRSIIRTSTHFFTTKYDTTGVAGYISTTGETWTSATQTFTSGSATQDRTVWDPAGSQMICTTGNTGTGVLAIRTSASSDSSVAWVVTGATTTSLTDSGTGIAYNGTRLVVVGVNGTGTSGGYSTVSWPSSLSGAYANIVGLDPASVSGNGNSTKLQNAVLNTSTNEFLLVGPQSIVTNFFGIIGIMASDGINFTPWAPVMRRGARNTADTAAVFAGGTDDGTHGAIYRSTDQTTWTRMEDGTFPSFNDLVFGNNLFIAVGNAGNILRSTDSSGDTFVSASISGYTGNIYTVTWTGSFFIFGVNNGVYKSTDGSTGFTFYSTGITGENRIIWNGTTHCAYGRTLDSIYTSTDGQTWTRRSTAITQAFISGIGGAGGNGVFIIAADITNSVRQRMLTSVDQGVTWAVLDSTATAAVIPVISYNLSGTTHVFAYSTRVRNQQWRATTTTAGTIGSWAALSLSAGSNDNSSSVMFATLFAFGRWILSTNAVSFVVGGSSNDIITQSVPDFKLGPSTPSPNGGYTSTSNAFYGACWDSTTSQFIVVGTNGFIGTFTNNRGLFKINHGITTNILWCVAAKNGVYVAAGSAGTILSSSDLSTWVARTSGYTAILYGAATI